MSNSESVLIDETGADGAIAEAVDAIFKKRLDFQNMTIFEIESLISDAPTGETFEVKNETAAEAANSLAKNAGREDLKFVIVE